MKHIKSLITGGAGFIGSHLADKLLELGHEVVVIDDLSSGKIENVPKNATFVPLRLGAHSKYHSNAVLDHALMGVDFVFNLAANPSVNDSLEDPVKTHAQTVSSTVQLLDRMRRMTKIPKLIQTSSCAVYGKGHDNEYICEESKKNFGTPYAAQKYMQELYVTTFMDLYSIPVVILRYFNVFGTKRQTEEGSYPNVISAFSKSMRETGKIRITGDGTQSRDFVHVFDVVDANIAAMNSTFCHGEVFNIGTGIEISINAIANYFDCPKEYIAPRQGDIQKSICDISKTKNLLEWESSISFEEGLNIYLRS